MRACNWALQGCKQFLPKQAGTIPQRFQAQQGALSLVMLCNIVAFGATQGGRLVPRRAPAPLVRQHRASASIRRWSAPRPRSWHSEFAMYMPPAANPPANAGLFDEVDRWLAATPNDLARVAGDFNMGMETVSVARRACGGSRAPWRFCLLRFVFASA